MTDWSILGGNPAPGSPDAFEATAQALEPIADVAESTSDSLRAMTQFGDSSFWSGNAADAFVESIHALPRDLGELVASHKAAIGALNDYAGTLSYLQVQAAEALARAQGAQSDIGSASASRAIAASRYSEANQRYWSYRSEIDVLEVERVAAGVAGDQAAVARLELEITSAMEGCNAAWAEQSAAAADVRTAQSALDSAQAQLANAQATADQIAADRLEAAQLLAGRLGIAAERSIAKRSWIDRVWADFDSTKSMFGSAGLPQSSGGLTSSQVFVTVKELWNATHHGISGARNWGGSFGPDWSRAGSTSLDGTKVTGSVTAAVGGKWNANANGSVSIHGATGSISAGAAIGASVLATGAVGSQMLGAGATGSVAVGASAEGSASGSITASGVKTSADIQAFAGGQASGSAGADVIGVRGTAQGEVYAGIGFHADASATISGQDVNLSCNVGAALGLGAGGGFKVHFDPEKSFHDLESVLPW